MFGDMERLIVASFVATRNVFIDSTMFARDGRWRNIFEDESGQPALGAGDFVVSSPAIQTFSMVGILVLFLLLAALLAVEITIGSVLGHYEAKSNANPNDARLLRHKVLTAVQLFRRIYEPGSGEKDDSWWCDAHLPRRGSTAGPEFKLEKCGGKLARCQGHIQGNIRSHETAGSTLVNATPTQA
jgi:hypothetical protein